jgi:hypothetical protein
VINADATIPAEATLKVLDGVEFAGRVNVDDDTLLANVRSAIRRPYPQIRPQALTYDRVVLVGGGPSLADTEAELVDLVQGGAKLVTVNGSYQWCLERNLFPKTQIVMDARPSNARFLEPYVPGCRYVLASQCAPEAFDTVAGRPDVWIFHAVNEEAGAFRELLDAHYLGQWFGVGGGVTVVTRAISLLRSVGYLRFDLFGVDCCFLGGHHHAYAQEENARDRAVPFDISPAGHPEITRTFQCAPWMAKQFECVLQMMRVNGQHFQLAVHGDGLLAYALAASADLQSRDDTGER